MADDPHDTSNISDTVDTTVVMEDAETTATRRELKQTTISEKNGQDGSAHQQQQSSSQSDDDTSAPADKAAAAPQPGRTTPDSDLSDSVTNHVSSPKKKRAHAELDQTRDDTDDVSVENDESKKLAAPGATKSRTDRSEPEKKRPRDRQAVESERRSQDGEEAASANSSARSSIDKTSDSKATTTTTTEIKPASSDKPATTSKSAFASSGFAKLASSTTSPFGALGGSGSPSIFGAKSSGSFSVLGGGSRPAASLTPTPPPPSAPPIAPPKMSFGSGLAASSPFSGLNGTGGGKSAFGGSFSGGSSAFGGGGGGGSVFGGGSSSSSPFGGSGLSGARLGNFGQPGNVLKSDKPARPFGAPESDAEDGSDDAADDRDSDNGDAVARSDDGKDSKETEGGDKDEQRDDKKKTKLHKIVVDDGESKEVTLLAVRAKMYQMEKGIGWKERGAGMLKVNVPKVSIELDGLGNPVSGSFDASMLDEDGDDDSSSGRNNVRLIMRQDHTLRVILNTVIAPTMSFKLTQKLKAAYVLFTAFDDDGEVRQVQMKLSDANATNFVNLMEMIQRQLSDV
ncbi:hypothetical protein B0T17DRAFT_618021 [Bombardia bombarda]|uniref:RanBD1 domain-containing protein n=1 Tax=Bombardia bombarda TaxID=252184 RepID=A0AA40C253_9PEZI|nr:hypothetical protein B0T17DRAFT_618021 [Bombardia bombarda]